MTRSDSHLHNHRCRSLQERRSDKRLLCSDLVKVRWESENGERREEIGILEDLSAFGASIFLGVAVATGAAIRLAAPDGEFAGEVRRCVKAPNGYLVGVHFEGGAALEPEHLLDVSRLDFSPEE